MSLNDLTEVLLAASRFLGGPDSEWFWMMAQVFVIGFSVWFLAKQIRLQGHSNMLSALFGLAAKWESDRMLDARHAVCTSFQTEQPSHTLDEKEERVASFFEDVGVYLSYGCFTREAIWEGYSYHIEHYWPLLEPKIGEFRHQTGDGTWFSHFESLYKAMRRVSRKKRAPVHPKTRAEMTKFIKGELQLIEKEEKGPQRMGKPSEQGSLNPADGACG